MAAGSTTLASPSPSGPTAPPPAAEGAVVAADRRVLERVLPCGVRVVVARDASLPVAAVVLALETGSEDDPSQRPGLVHALAYHLLQGNRDLPPGGITALLHDAGGLAFLATGPAQIRFESLLPVSLLDAVVSAEARRLRAPTVTARLWEDTLTAARRDEPRHVSAPRNAIAAAHGAPGLQHDGRRVADAVAALSVDTVQAELAARARYERATFVVVAPNPIEETFATVRSALDDLPTRSRDAPRRVHRRTSSTVTTPAGTGRELVWGIEGAPGPRLWAAAWCAALNRQRRSPAEPKTARIRCSFDDDPRRPTLTIEARGTDDPVALIEHRIRRLADPDGARLLEGQVARQLRDLNRERARPLPLARRLSASVPAMQTGDRSVLEMLGASALEGPLPPATAVLRLDTAVRVMPPPKETPKP